MKIGGIVLANIKEGMSARLIVVRLKGGIGNQMFQYAAGRALASRLGAQLMLDTSVYLRARAKRRLGLFDFRVRAGSLSHWERCAIGSGEGRLKLKCRIGALLHGVPPRRIRLLKQIGNCFQEFPPDLRGNILLEGYWQDPRYFSTIAGEIRTEFTLKNGSRLNRQALAEIESSNAVAVHVRRGDYVAGREPERFAVCELSYYLNAIERMRATLESPTFFMFSDDIGWVRDNIPAESDVRYIEGDAVNPAADLELMRSCRHFIISNSSFGWWGAWLAVNADKIVLVPSLWLNDDPDFHPALPHWIRINP